MRVTPLAIVFLAAALPAQVFRVDVNNGPGTNFTSLAAAVAAVPDGATLLVQPGAYPGPIAILGKGLTILGSPGASIASGGLRIENTTASQPTTVRGFSIAGPTSPPYAIVWVFACQGRIVLENIAATSPPVSSGAAPMAFSVAHTPQVTVRNGTFSGGCVVFNSHVAAEASSFTGMNAMWGPSMAGPGFSARAAINVGGGGTLQLAGCSAQGGAGACQGWICVSPPAPQFDNKPALEINGGTAVVRAPGTLTGGATFAQGPAITGPGTVRIDPAVVTNGAVAVSPPARIAAMPSMSSASASLGGTLTATANGPSGTLLLLLLGLPGPALFVPGIVDPFWMDPAGHLYAAIGTSQPLTASLNVPVLQPLLGFAVVWQTVAFDPVAGLLASQPSTAFVF